MFDFENYMTNFQQNLEKNTIQIILLGITFRG